MIAILLRGSGLQAAKGVTCWRADGLFCISGRRRRQLGGGLLLEAGHKVIVLALEDLDLLLEGQLDGLHHAGVLGDQRGLWERLRVTLRQRPNPPHVAAKD